MASQETNTVLLIRPASFRQNKQTSDNDFQHETDKSNNIVQSLAEQEFESYLSALRNSGINTIIVDDTPDPVKPDAIFPNNWFTTHEDGRVALYPLYAPNRRPERRTDVFDQLKEIGFNVSSTIDYSSYEKDELFLEGTGALVLDRENKIAYCCLSNRSCVELLNKFCNDFGYEPVTFTSARLSEDGTLHPIYHTNVIMAIASNFSVICLESIIDNEERESVKKHLEDHGKEIIDISMEQVESFAGNMLSVQNDKGEKFLVMSSSAYYSLTQEQLATITKYSKIIHSDLATIEQCGGGSARCMLAEIFLPKSKEE